MCFFTLFTAAPSVAAGAVAAAGGFSLFVGLNAMYQDTVNGALISVALVITSPLVAVASTT